MKKTVLTLCFFHLLLFGNILAQSNPSLLEMELSAIVRNFQNGLDTEEEFTEILDDLDDLLQKIEEIKSPSERTKLKGIYESAEALESFIGEMSPGQRNWDLTNVKKNIAEKLLSGTFTKAPVPGKHCMVFEKYIFWGDKYVAYVITNEDICLYQIAYNFFSASGNCGVDKQSSRALHEFWRGRGSILKLQSFTCERSRLCN